jgi:hypothetical protein
MFLDWCPPDENDQLDFAARAFTVVTRSIVPSTCMF